MKERRTMKYKVGKIAQMLDVSIETVRNYEKIGLIQPERSEQNDYRLYDPVDVNILRRARTYMGYYGVSMKQSAQLLLGGDIPDLADALGESAQGLSERIAFDIQLLMFTREKQRHLQRIGTILNQYVVENSPAMYGFVYRNGSLFSSDPDVQRLLHEWNQLRPFTEASVHYDQACFLDRNYHLSQGLLIEEAYAAFFHIAAGEHIHYFPARKCLYTFAVTALEPDITPENTFRFALGDALRERGLTIAGNPFGRVVHTGKASGRYQHYIELWVPIE